MAWSNGKIMVLTCAIPECRNKASVGVSFCDTHWHSLPTYVRLGLTRSNSRSNVSDYLYWRKVAIDYIRHMQYGNTPNTTNL